jgi:hypothetical protein
MLNRHFTHHQQKGEETAQPCEMACLRQLGTDANFVRSSAVAPARLPFVLIGIATVPRIAQTPDLQVW